MDSTNQAAFNQRYSNPTESLRLANSAYSKALKEDDAVTQAYSVTNKFFAKILLSDSTLDLQEQLLAHETFSEKNIILGKVMSAANLAMYYESIAQYTRSMSYLSIAFADMDSLNPEVKSQVLSTAASVYSKMGQHEKALDLQSQSLKLRLSEQDMAGAAASYNQIGRTLGLLNRKKEALEHYTKSLEIRKELNESTSTAWTYLGMGSLFNLNNQFKKALESLEKGLQLSAENDQRCKVHLLTFKGEALYNLEDFNTAQDVLDQAQQLAYELNAEDLYLDAIRLLATIQEKIGDDASALEYWKQFYQTNDKIQKEEAKQRTAQLELALEAEFAVRKAAELKVKNDELDRKNHKITSSINYASVIQKAILPRPNDVQSLLPESFVVYRPKDIVSGDFYWTAEIDGKIIIAVGDCTGHGVPGAFMSMIGSDQLNHIVFESSVQKPSEILNQMHLRTKRALHQHGNHVISNDGMELAVCLIDLENDKLIYSGANRPLIRCEQNGKQVELKEIKPTKLAIGGKRLSNGSFQDHEIRLSENQNFYIFSDGIQDQFDSSFKYKFSRQRLRFLLRGIANLEVAEQKKIVNQILDEWMGNQDQTDDIVLFGFRVSPLVGQKAG